MPLGGLRAVVHQRFSRGRVLRSHNNRRNTYAARSRSLAFLAGALLLGGCSLSVVESDAIPTTTGSIAPPVDLQQPLPPTLAFSDATKIGQAATAVLAQAEGGPASEWINASTGSSGTLEPEAALGSSAGSSNCRHFSTIVTSVGGVHRYSGAICPRDGGPAIVQIDERSKEDRTS